MLRFETEGLPLTMAPTRCLVAGWTGRDAAKVQHHIEELAEIGVPPPSTTPLYYRAACCQLTQAPVVEAVSPDTGGEAEPVVLDAGEAGLWMTLGSDHTDRALEAHSVAYAKAIGAKVLAGQAWPLAPLAERLDDLRLTAEISADGAAWTPYQDGTLAAIRPLASLVDGAPEAAAGRLGAGSVMFCGTIAAIGGIRPTLWFRAALSDPASGATIRLAYRTRVLPLVA
ncbi:MAG: DUF2848 family protein [Pseudomonadota bacterium]